MDHFSLIKKASKALRVTLKHIADDTGMSIATVSRALNRSKRKHTPSEKIIYASARKLGYPFIGGDTVDEDQLTVALVTEVHEGEFYSSLFHGFYRASKKTASDVLFVNLAKHSDDPIEHIINLSKKYSGICLFLPNLDKIDYSRLKEGVGQYPILSLTPMKNSKIDTISFDSYSGGYMIAEYFEELGYTKFGFISGPPAAVDAVFRKNGFLDHIQESNELELVWSFAGDFSLSSGKAAFNDFKNTGLKDIAIFGCNDHTCFGFMKGAIENGYQIPDDFIIAGYDNLSFCKTFTPELTSIATDFYKLGKKAIRIIENMVAEGSDSLGHKTMLPVEIKTRGSTYMDG